MFKWLKNLFGVGEVEKAVEAVMPEPVKTKPEPKVETKATTKKKTTSKKSEKTDLSGMSKNDLLAHAKKNGVKANASMKKADILSAIKNG